ncbi:S-adenosyl-L-homocysteine hydrolase [Mucor velutinosus]|uniref:S-adenosyl-L-homocysteine hydrolase n=1 Tax=Mucor velutinosus TaxID=708070 RepID=A0AAN7HXA3_9FUNG|nr:S-adenosyl-L-homocysteine hydrolase [Mucor velutinosus]
MNKELHSLVSKYKIACLQLEEIHAKIETVNSSEQAIANHLSASTSTSTSTQSSSQTPKDTDEKLNQIISKLKLDVDAVLSKRLAETKSTKSAVQSYIDNTVWSLFSRTELQNDTLLFNNDQKRIDDKKCLHKLISTLFALDQEQVENEEYKAQLHGWMIHIVTIYLRLGSKMEKHKILALLSTTSNIASWAMPLIHIQADKMSQADDFLDTVDAIFIQPKTWTWTEDDFLAVLDQLAIDFNYNKLVDSVDPDQQVSLETVLKFSQDLINKLMQAIHRSGEAMNSLVKRLAQTVIQISISLIDAIIEKGWECQDQVDAFMSQLIFGFYDLKETGGWFFLPNIPFKALSIDALWLVTVRMLQLKDASIPPGSLNEVLGDHLPNITRFQYQLHDNQMQGYFMLNCLTNMAACIPSGVDETSAINDPKSTVSACIVTVISYTLFTVAFVDKDLREDFYKDVRDSFGAICRCHPFVISLLFRWTAEHMAIMERMALYLFHSLKLDNWNILKDDLKLLHKLMSCASKTTSMTSQQKAQIQLAKYIIQHLNYGYKHGMVDPNVSKSQPWHSRKMPFLSYDTHEEIAFILLDVCQQFQPLPDTTHTNENKGAIELVGTVTTAVSTYLPIADQIQLLKSTYDHSTSNNNRSNGNTANDFIHWAWSVAAQLKLYDCPVSPRASDIENSITLPFLKLVLNSYNNVSSSHSALLVYISFALSATSRHFLRFESNGGWMKLLVVLKKGKPEAVIRIFSDMVPSFVYMHGDDFFNDESLSDFLKHMIELKTDPMLIKAAAKVHKTNGGSGIGLMIGSHVWHAHLIDSVSDLMDDQGKGFSYVDLVLHSWLKTVFRKADWMWHSGYVHIVDHLCKFAFVLYRHGMVYHMLAEEHKRMEATRVQQSASSPRLTRFIKNMVVSDGGPYASLLNGEWSMLKPAKGPGVEQNYHWFAFEVLVMETISEAPFREELCALVTKQLSTSLANDQEQQQQHQQQQKFSIDFASLYKLTSQKKPMDYLVIYRWVQHIMMMPVDHPLLPLYLQMFFSLYYLNIHDEVTLGFVCFHKKTDWTTKLRDYIASVQTYYGQKITTTTPALVANYDDNYSQEEQDNSGHRAVNAEVLQQFYYAMWLWLGNADLSNGLVDTIHHLPSHYNVHRLKLCYAKKVELDQPWHHTEDYWMDLVDTEQLEQDFLNFPWEGSEKFRTDGDAVTDAPAASSSVTTADDLISLSTTTRRLRLITDESTIEPLPPLVINTPSTSTSTSSIKKKMGLK